MWGIENGNAIRAKEEDRATGISLRAARCVEGSLQFEQGKIV